MSEQTSSDSKALLTTNRKALTINLDDLHYGTFAEIGAGQEVARLFFQAGGAAGTIAKSISAYDMAFSDAIYGKAPRYVSRERMETMLDHEYKLLLVLLEKPGRVFTRDQLLDQAWQDPGAVTDRTIDAHIKSIRAKLRAIQAGAEDLIQTRRGLGYLLVLG